MQVSIDLIEDAGAERFILARTFDQLRSRDLGKASEYFYVNFKKKLNYGGP